MLISEERYVRISEFFRHGEENKLLGDCDLIENYDVIFTDKPMTLRQLLPMKWYKTIYGLPCAAQENDSVMGWAA